MPQSSYSTLNKCLHKSQTFPDIPLKPERKIKQIFFLQIVGGCFNVNSYKFSTWI